jgi:hypothetical protein
LLLGRDEVSHKALASEMLYRAIIGPESYNHPEWQAFISGFKLPCRNGFNFLDVSDLCRLEITKYRLTASEQVPRAFTGGSEAFFSLVWTSYISDFASLEPHLDIRPPAAHFTSQLIQLAGDQTASFSGLLCNFLRGSGVPCPGLFAAVQNGFDSVIDLSQIDSTGFRARMFVWAAAGSPSLDLSDHSLMVCSSSLRNVFLQQS